MLSPAGAPIGIHQAEPEGKKPSWWSPYKSASQGTEQKEGWRIVEEGNVEYQAQEIPSQK